MRGDPDWPASPASSTSPRSPRPTGSTRRPGSTAWRAAGRLGRGVFGPGPPLPGGEPPPPPGLPRLAVPLAPPVSPLNRLTLGAFNAHLPAAVLAAAGAGRLPYPPASFRSTPSAAGTALYGSAGFYQYQCVVPPADRPDAVAALLGAIAGPARARSSRCSRRSGSGRRPGCCRSRCPGRPWRSTSRTAGLRTLASARPLDGLCRRRAAGSIRQGRPHEWRGCSARAYPVLELSSVRSTPHSPRLSGAAWMFPVPPCARR